MSTYFCSADPNSRPIIAAGLDDGSIEAWRIDSTGRQWFRTTPTIQGVPRREPFDVLADLADDDADDDADEDCLFIDDDGEQQVYAAGNLPPFRAVDPGCSVEFE